jgi:hypothetical protein
MRQIGRLASDLFPTTTPTRVRYSLHVEYGDEGVSYVAKLRADIARVADQNELPLASDPHARTTLA